MDLKQLINYVNNKAFTTPEDELFVFGRFGYVRAKASGLSRYTVDKIGRAHV